MGLDLAQALLGSAFAGETLSGVGSSNVTEEVWAGVDQEPDPAETGRGRCGNGNTDIVHLRFVRRPAGRMT